MHVPCNFFNLKKIGKEFDIIESAGVLHHVEEPMVGWRVVGDLLKPGGVMKIGLYSELARQHIVSVREEIALLKMGGPEFDIRKFRRSLAESQDENHQRVSKSSDFFSLSKV